MHLKMISEEEAYDPDELIISPESFLDDEFESDEKLSEKPFEIPLAASLETPLETTLKTSLETTSISSLEIPLQTSVPNLLENSLKNSVLNLLENSLEKSVENSVPNLLENSLEKSVENSVPNSLENSLEKSVKNSVEKSVEKPAETPNNKALKRPHERTTFTQKNAMVNFIIDNPELITHSSTKENEIALWSSLHKQLNDLKPERSLDKWKNFLQRWKCQILTKEDTSLNAVELKLKQFLKKLTGANDQLTNSETNAKSTNSAILTVKDILEKINQVEKERSNLRLEVDNNELRINKYRYLIHTLEDENSLKREKIKRLSNAKVYLNKRRRLLQEKDKCDEPVIQVKVENENENSVKKTEA